MNKLVAALNLGISGYFIVNIVMHMIRPGDNTGYTRMLMFACLATIPLAFMMILVGGRDRWPMLLAEFKALAAGGPISWLLLMGLILLLILLPLALLVGTWYGMGLRFGSMFILYLTPVFLRLAIAPVSDAIKTGLVLILILFASFFIGLGIVWFFKRFLSGIEIYQRHLQVIWPDYRDAAKMFFSVCVFALLNQLIEFFHALRQWIQQL